MKTRFVGDEYRDFCRAMTRAAEFDELPLMLGMEEPDDVVVGEFAEFAKNFRNDTGLELEMQVYVCPNCDKTHLHIIVDHPQAYYGDEDGDEEW